MQKFGEPAIYNGELYLSQTEARWAAYFDATGIPAIHEPQTFSINIGLDTEKYHLYTPDFVLPDHGNTFIEVKNGPIYMDGVLKARQLARGVGDGVLLLNSAPQKYECVLFLSKFTKAISMSAGR